MAGLERKPIIHFSHALERPLKTISFMVLAKSIFRRFTRASHADLKLYNSCFIEVEIFNTALLTAGLLPNNIETQQMIFQYNKPDASLGGQWTWAMHFPGSKTYLMIDVAAHMNGFEEYHDIPVAIGTIDEITDILRGLYEARGFTTFRFAKITDVPHTF